MQHSLFGLLKLKRFGPFFATQFFGAFNDNVFKNALVIMITFQAVVSSELDADVLVNACAGLFILPFFLFSATAGQLADKYEKSFLIRLIKGIEILVMSAAAIGFYTGNIYFLLAVLFLMGAQSTFFGPIKYGILPQHLKENELIAGNAIVEMGTFLAILLGIIAGSKLIGVEGWGSVAVSTTIIVVAILGLILSFMIPVAEAADPQLKLNWNPVVETWNTIQYTRSNDAVFKSIMGISWFWFFGATLLTQLPNYTLNVLHSSDDVYILLLAMFSVGVGLGSVLCERLSGEVVEIGLVPIGSFLITLFCADLYFASAAFEGVGQAVPLQLSAFWEIAGSWRILIDIIFIGIAGGFFIVPLYALVQQRSEPRIRSRIIAGNNIFNALFMVLSAVFATLLLKLGVSIPQLFLVTAILNILIALYIFTLVPEFMMRCLVWLLVNTLYRIKHEGLEHIPDEGAAVVVCNHVSFVDALVLASCSRRPVRFVMYYKIFAMPVISFIFRTSKAIPIASAKEDPVMMENAFDEISKALEQGEIVCIFPEGKLTGDGEIDVFKGGVERILQRNPVPVVPMALCGLWGSFFSRKEGAAMRRPFRRIWSKIELHVGAVIPAQQVDKQRLQEEVAALRGDCQ